MAMSGSNAGSASDAQRGDDLRDDAGGADQLPDEPMTRRDPVLVAIASWLVPGLGYWLLGLRTRGITVGITVVVLFILGLLIGGVRVMEVPFYDKIGQRVDESFVHELRAKPWSIAQVMAGPIAIAGGAASIWASQPGPDGRSRGADSHARLNDIAILYTAVAGMLNLLAIIDASSRAGALDESVETQEAA